MAENKKKVVRIDSEEFKKLPKADQERLIANAKAREMAVKAKASESIDQLLAENTTDTAKARAFNKVYLYVRPALTILKAQKKVSGDMDKVIADTKKMLTTALNMLEA